MNPGYIALLNYGERPTTWHMRVLLAPTTPPNWVILTPDHDIYEEEMSPGNPDLVGFHHCGPSGQIPPRINPGNVYGFAPMVPQALRGFMDQGQAEAARILGVPVAGALAAGAAGLVQAAPAVAVASSGCPWACNRHLGGFRGWQPFQARRHSCAGPQSSSSRACSAWGPSGDTRWKWFHLPQEGFCF